MPALLPAGKSLDKICVILWEAVEMEEGVGGVVLGQVGVSRCTF